MKILGKKNTRRINKMLKGVSAAGTLGRKTGHYVEALGKGAISAGLVMENPALAAAGADAVAIGDSMQVGGIAMRKTSEGIRKGDKSKVISGVKHAMEVV